MTYFIRRQTGLSTYSVNEFEWTIDKPTESGWYWVWDKNSVGPFIVEVDDRDGEMNVISDDGGVIDLSFWSHWIGPLPKPFAIGTFRAD